jgi:hypothetical protein
MRPFRITLLLTLAVVASPGQSINIPDSLRSIADEISSLPESDLNALGKTRDLLGRSILNGDLSKAGQVLSYIDARFDSTRIITLYPRERLLVEFWVGCYDRVLADPEHAADLSWKPEPLERIYRRPRLAPERDLLLEDLLDHTRKRRTVLMARTQAANLGEEQRHFLRVFATALIGPDPSVDDGERAFRATMNDEANGFLEMYPRSTFVPFVRRYLRVVLRPSPWAFGIGAGVGGVRMEGELSRRFTSGMSFDLWGEASYGRAYLMVWGTLGTLSEVRSTFVYHQTWVKGMAVSPSGLTAAAGYTLNLGRSIVLTPHAGWAYVDISPPEQERTKTGFDGKMDFGAAVIGVNLDIPFHRSDDVEMVEGVEQGYQFVRARFALMSSRTHIQHASGTIITFTLSYGLFGRPVERDL